MPIEIRREHAPPTSSTLASLQPLAGPHHDALHNATALWTFWSAGELVGFAAARAQPLPARRAVVARFTAVCARPGHDARALRAAAARALAQEHPGLTCEWVTDVRPEARMSPQARAAASDAIAVLAAHLAWAGLRSNATLRRVC